ncbi:N-acyl-D-amino-acid deacylase family protein [Winogradskyella sp. PG-2]|uniref:N-acyl-D-amino-acid deacylase family protein n=1 Tax=Winogradskyella sp. PG-2 TaxID=754409 RepID=UPI000458773E|nr:amidohydrolase family protein [Winogradskyella sp. PG-2]BAO77280.1 N-acyl-D-amino-acid deacylase [Winogradskyella sp. PG-2]
MRQLYFLFVLPVLFCFSCANESLELDILILNGTVYDGSSLQASNQSIGIKDDKIVYFGNGTTTNFIAQKTIDATGLIVSPGFIDPHTHADRELKDKETSYNLPFLFQGITTVVVGNDGDSFYPTSDYKNLYESNGIGTNALLLFGHGTIREQVMGKSDRKVTSKDIAKMKALAQQEMNAGAFGMSTGLFYAPGSYSNTEDVIALAQTVSENDGIYDTHLRDESSYTVGLIPAIEEAIEIGRQAKLPIHISHIKCLGVDVWHQSDSILKLIESAQNEGIEVTANQYPYDASATGLKSAVAPRWAESGGKDSLLIRYNTKDLKQRILADTKNNITRRGGPDKLLIVKSEDSAFVGKTLLEISQLLNTSPEEAVYIALNSGYVRVASFNMNTKDIHNFMKQSWVVTGSDGNTGHPRKYGSFPRKYHKYVKEDKVIDIATFINNSTSKTAKIFKIKNRGKLQKGNFADIIIFNPKTFKDVADYKDAFQLSQGLEYSIINGRISIDNGIYNNELNGCVLKK